MKKRQAEGFTLIELMIVIVIIGILAAIAYPAYIDQVRKSRRADCAGVVTGLAAAMERNFTELNTYMGLADNGAGGTTNNGPPLSRLYPAKCPIAGTTVYYNLTIAVPTPTTYTITATGAGDQAVDKCGNLTLTNTGIKGLVGNIAGRTVARCW